MPAFWDTKNHTCLKNVAVKTAVTNLTSLKFSSVNRGCGEISFLQRMITLLENATVLHRPSSVAPLKSLYFHWTAICSSSIVFTPRSLFLLFVLLFCGLIVEDLTTAATSPVVSRGLATGVRF